jgi:RNA-dependent RNA polymerase
LGYTESHLKESTLVLLQETPNMSAKKLLTKIGDLKKVYLKDGCGKYAARLGLSFSSTLEGPSVSVI